MPARRVRSYVLTAARDALLLLVLVAAIVTPPYMVRSAYTDALENGEYGRLSLAERGDFWGGYLGGPMAFVGAAFFLVALMMQRHELSLQRRELAESKASTKNKLTSSAVKPTSHDPEPSSPSLLNCRRS